MKASSYIVLLIFLHKVFRLSTGFYFYVNSINRQNLTKILRHLMTKQNMLKASKLDFHICIIFLGSQVNFVKINRSFTLTYLFLGVEDFLSKLLRAFSLFALE